jgi:hypothetical protein
MAFSFPIDWEDESGFLCERMSFLAAREMINMMAPLITRIRRSIDVSLLVMFSPVCKEMDLVPFKVSFTAVVLWFSGSGVTALRVDGVGSCDIVGIIDVVGVGVGNIGSPTGERVGDRVIVGRGDMLCAVVGSKGSEGLGVIGIGSGVVHVLGAKGGEYGGIVPPRSSTVASDEVGTSDAFDAFNDGVKV